MATPSSSSTKKAARLAQKGQGKKIRFQGGTLFPLIVAMIIVLGFSLIIYARQSRPPADASDPQLEDHWHHVYGFYLCDTWVQLQGDAEESDSTGLLNTEFARTGVHSHEDGLIHWHPFSGAAVGRNATLGVFLDVYSVELDNDKLVFPENQLFNLPYETETGVFEDGETKCVIDGEEKDAELKVIVWDDFQDTSNGTTYIADYNNIRLDSDAKVISLAFVPSDTDVPLPPWAAQFLERAAADTGGLAPAEGPSSTDPMSDGSDPAGHDG